MVDRLIKRGNFDDKTEAIEKRCATFQVNIERGITRRAVFAGRHLIEWKTMDGILWQIKRLSSLRGSPQHRFCKCEFRKTQMAQRVFSK
jgi:hypothetical protein